MTSPTTSCTQTGMSENLSTSTQCSIAKDVTPKGPWNGPELTKSPEFVLDTLRETQHMINSLNARKEGLKKEVNEMFEAGQLAHLVDEKDSQKYNGDGISVAICKGKTKRIYEDEVQAEIDALQQQIDKVKYIAERKQQFTEETGRSYWRVNLAKEKDEIL